jgi:hypothetical protein
LFARDLPEFANALVVKDAVSSAQELRKIERPDLLGFVAIG